MFDSENQEPGALSGAEAVSWLLGARRTAPKMLDSAFLAVRDAFSGDANVAAYVAASQGRWEPRYFFLGIQGDIGRGHDWSQLVDAYAAMHARIDHRLSESERSEAEKFHLVLWPEGDQFVPIETAIESWWR